MVSKLSVKTNDKLKEIKKAMKTAEALHEWYSSKSGKLGYIPVKLTVNKSNVKKILDVASDLVGFSELDVDERCEEVRDIIRGFCSEIPKEFKDVSYVLEKHVIKLEELMENVGREARCLYRFFQKYNVRFDEEPELYGRLVALDHKFHGLKKIRVRRILMRSYRDIELPSIFPGDNTYLINKGERLGIGRVDNFVKSNRIQKSVVERLTRKKLEQSFECDYIVLCRNERSCIWDVKANNEIILAPQSEKIFIHLLSHPEGLEAPEIAKIVCDKKLAQNLNENERNRTKEAICRLRKEFGDKELIPPQKKQAKTLYTINPELKFIHIMALPRKRMCPFCGQRQN